MVRSGWLTRERQGSEPYSYRVTEAGRNELSRVANAVAWVFQRTMNIERPQTQLADEDFRFPKEMPPLTGVDYLLLSLLPSAWTTPEQLESSARAFGLDWGDASSRGQFSGLYRSLGRWVGEGYVERNNDGHYRLLPHGNRERLRFLLFFWSEGF
jgi:DNA-binding PadR family transcriptional regulator